MAKCVVFVKKNCVQCDATKRRMVAKGVDFDQVSLEESPDVVAELQRRGFQAAPVVVPLVEGESRWDGAWSGYRPSFIDMLMPTRSGS